MNKQLINKAVVATGISGLAMLCFRSIRLVATVPFLLRLLRNDVPTKRTKNNS